MRLAERDTQLRDLQRLLADCDASRGSVVLIEGPVACGKSELLRAASTLATDRGALVLQATCSPTERSLPFAVVGQFAAHLGALAAAVPLAETAEPRASSHATARVAQRICRVLLEVAGSRTVLITVDDLRHADDESVHCLLHLARRIGPARIMVLLTDDVRHHTTHLDLRAELLRQQPLHTLSVRPLSAAGVRTLVPAGSPAEVVAGVVAGSGGNPRLARMLVTDHLADGRPRAQGYGLALLGCLHHADPLAMTAARALAVLGRAEPHLVERVAGADVSDALAAMSAAGLVGPGGLRHEVARAAVLAELSPGERSELHHAAATALHESGADAHRIAEQVLAASRADAPWAVAALVEAAEQAMVEDAPATAVAFLTVADEREPDRGRRTEVQVRLTEAQWRLSPATSGRNLGRLAERTRAGELAVPDQLTLARKLLWHGRTAEASGVINEARTHARRPRAVAELRAFEMWLTLGHPALARRSQAPQPLLVPADVADPRTDPWLPTAARLAGLVVRGAHQDGTSVAREVLLGQHLSRRTAWVEESASLAVLVLLGAGRLDEVARWSAGTGRSTWPALAATARAEVALRRGDLRDAAEAARVAVTERSPRSWGVAIGHPLGTLVHAATLMGDYEDAARQLASVGDRMSEQLLRSRYGLTYLHARGVYYLATNHGYPALSDFLSCGALVREWGLDASDLVPWRTSAAAAWLRLGNPDQAKLLINEQLGTPTTGRSRNRGTALRVLAAASPPPRRPELLAEALELAEDCGDRFEQARVLADLSGAHSLLGEERRARMVFRRAWHLAAEVGATPIHHELLATSGDLRSPAEPDPSPEASTPETLTTLTTSERRVAALAAMGCTNREIAERLHVTASTVEQHLTRAYRKLNVKRRRDLPADLRVEPAYR